MTFAVFEVKYEEGGNPPVFSANETSLEITTTGLKAATYYTVSVRVWDSGVPSPFSEEIVVATGKIPVHHHNIDQYCRLMAVTLVTSISYNQIML